MTHPVTGVEPDARSDDRARAEQPNRLDGSGPRAGTVVATMEH